MRRDVRAGVKWGFTPAVFLLMGAGVQGQEAGQFQGSVPTGTATEGAIRLTLNDAIQRGLKANLGVLTRNTSSEAAKAQRLHALSALMPQVTASFGETEQQVNLSTFGFNFKFPTIPGFNGIPTVVGPFHYAAAQAFVSAKIFDYNARKTYSAAKESEKAAELAAGDARDLVVQAVANGYLLIIADASRVESLKAQVRTAQALYGKASDLKTAGLSPGIDVLRAQVEMKQEQQKLLAQQNQYDKDKLSLGRVIGLAPGQEFTLADSTPFAPLETMKPEDAVKTAYQQRADYQSAKRQVRAAEEAVKAARGEWYPTVDLNGFYGDEGPTLNNSHGVFTVTGAVNFNIFNGGRIRSDVEQARATLKQRSDDLADLGGQIDYQVRAALLDIGSAADQVAVAQSNLELANQTLDQARDRFTAGVADNIEVVQAQESVATANDVLLGALYSHNVAKAALARSLGLAEQGIQKFIEVK